MGSYIFGNNVPRVDSGESREKVAMTAPVRTEPPQKVSMTSPVRTELGNGLRKMKISFVMPRKVLAQTCFVFLVLNPRFRKHRRGFVLSTFHMPLLRNILE